MKIDVQVCFKDIEDTEMFENVEQIEVNEKGKFIFLSVGKMEYYILHDKVLWFEINYKEEGK